MNRIIISNNEEADDSDATSFVSFLSQFIGVKLDPQKDQVVLIKPQNPSRNAANHLVYCDINAERRVALKRCSDIPDFIRRELVTPQAQKVAGFPSYKAEEVHGITLKNKGTSKNCSILTGWEGKTFLAIDYGNPKLMKTLRSIKKDEIKMLEFFYNYGKWCAFNCLFGVKDRHDNNFVISVNDETVYSVDNEEGPFDPQNKSVVPIQLIVSQLKSGMERFFGGPEEKSYKEKLREGFIDGWNQILRRVTSFTMFNKEEQVLLAGSLQSDPEKIFGQLFY